MDELLLMIGDSAMSERLTADGCEVWEHTSWINVSLIFLQSTLLL